MARKSTLQFVKSRVFRIFPALIVAVFISAFVMGPFVTELGFQEYFSHGSVYSYFLNNASLSAIQFKLPGVF